MFDTVTSRMPRDYWQSTMMFEMSASNQTVRLIGHG
jgi:hypothetical protein